MNIVLLVATNAGERQFVFGWVWAVAAVASDLLVGAVKRKGGFVVVEFDQVPSLGAVAILAFCAEPALVHVISLVAADAGQREPGEGGAGMARAAFGLGMSARQRKRVMLERSGLLPTARAVAISTIGAELSSVRIVFSVAGAARSGGSAEFGFGAVARCAA